MPACIVVSCSQNEELKLVDVLTDMIKKKDIVDYFWTFGNLITTEKGVELEMHGDNLLVVSVMLCCAAKIEINELEPMVQLIACFEDFDDMQQVLGIEKLEGFKKVTIANMLRLYAKDIAKMEEIDY